MKQKGDKPSAGRSIYLRTVAGFLVFYLLAMLAMTAVMQQSIRRNNVTRLYLNVQEASGEVYAEDRREKTLARLLYKASRPLEAMPYPVKLFICDESYNVLAESGTMLVAFYHKGNGSYSVGSYLEGLSDAQLLEIWQQTQYYALSPVEGTTEKRRILQALGHWEGEQLVASELYITEETWRTGESGNSYLLGREQKSVYPLSEPHPDDELIDYCQLEGGSYWPSGSTRPVYNSRVQQGFRDSAQVLDWVKSELAAEKGQIISGGRGKGFWAYDIYALQASDAVIEGQELGYIIATARTYPVWQAMRALWPLYLVGLAVALALAGLMGRQLLKMQRQSQQLEDSRQALMIAVAHELKNPLSVIKSYSEGLLENIAQDKRDDYLQVIIDETERMDQMVVELLSLTRLKSAEASLRKETLSLEELLQSVGARYAHQIEERQLQLDIQVEPGAAVLAEGRLMEQAVGNLLANAIRHTPDGGRITITADKAELTVANQGPRIDEDKWPHLFEPFYKTEADRSRAGGTGLGLALVRAIMELHGMEAGGRNLEDGVAFTLYFGGQHCQQSLKQS